MSIVTPSKIWKYGLAGNSTQIKSVASAEGTSLKALLKVTIFITSFESITQLREVLFKEYGENLPASSLVRVASLFSPEINIEIEAVLAVPDA